MSSIVAIKRHEHGALARLILDWTAWTADPLTIEELQYAIYYSSVDKHFNIAEFAVELVLDICQNICQNFLRLDLQSGQIIFIHSSAQQYVRDTGNSEAVHKTMAHACLRSDHSDKINCILTNYLR
jgi:hypothetical protein